MKIGVKAVSELPLHPCRARCADRDAARAQSDAGPDQARRDRAASQRHHADRRRRHQAAPDLDRRRPVLDVLHRRGRARPGPFRLGRLHRLGDAAVDALADKFDVVQDDRLEIGRSHPFGARVTITTDDGVHERLYADPSGEPNSFPDAQAMQQKFLTLARPVLNGRADQLADAILSLERFDRVEKATQLGGSKVTSPRFRVAPLGEVNREAIRVRGYGLTMMNPTRITLTMRHSRSFTSASFSKNGRRRRYAREGDRRTINFASVSRELRLAGGRRDHVA